MLCRKAFIYITLSVLFWSCFVVVGKGALEALPPITVLAVEVLLAAICAFIYLIFARLPLLPTGAWKYVFLSGLLNAIVYHGLILFALQGASSSVVAILATTEVLTTFLFFKIFAGISSTKAQLFGAMLIIVASSMVVGENLLKEELGTEYWALLAAAVAPVGNYFQKKSISIINAGTHLMWRSIIGGFLLLLLSLGFEQEGLITAKILEVLPYLIAGGVLAMFFSKLFLLKSMSLADVPFVIAIANTSPGATMILAFFLLGEVPTVVQVCGFFVMLLGAKFVLLKR